MASSHPIVRQVAWIALLPQLAAILVFIGFAAAAGFEKPVLPGAAGYLVLSFVLRTRIPVNHRQGMKLFRQGLFGEALLEFERSYEFFSRHRWLDDWRFLVLSSSSRISYREMALLNQAFCLGQIGETARARAVYQRTLQEFPGSLIATDSLRLMDGLGKPAVDPD